MRKSKVQFEMEVPSWYNCEHIVEQRYGDMPKTLWNEAQVEYWRKKIPDAFAVQKYMWVCNGDFYEYELECGVIHIDVNGKFLSGEITIYNRGVRYNIYLVQMYGKKALTIHKETTTNLYIGFINKDGIGAPSSVVKELEEDDIYTVLNKRMEDYGDIVRNFLSACKKLYEEDKTNYIYEKRWTHWR